MSVASKKIRRSRRALWCKQDPMPWRAFAHEHFTLGDHGALPLPLVAPPQGKPAGPRKYESGSVTYHPARHGWWHPEVVNKVRTGRMVKIAPVYRRSWSVRATDAELRVNRAIRTEERIAHAEALGCRTLARVLRVTGQAAHGAVQ